MKLKNFLIFISLYFYIGIIAVFAQPIPPNPDSDMDIPLEGSELMLILAGGLLAVYMFYKNRAKKNVTIKN